MSLSPFRWCLAGCLALVGLLTGCATTLPADKPPPGFAQAPRAEGRFAAVEQRVAARHGAGVSAFQLLERNADGLVWRVALIENADRVGGRAELLERAWPGLAVEPNNLQVQVCALRKLLGTEAIVTVARRGYRYTGPAVRTADAVPGVRAPRALATPAVAIPVGESARRQLRWQSRPR